MKAILLTCNTGQGHNSAAAAIKDALEKRGAICETKDALAFLGEAVSDTIAGAFVNIAVKTPRAFGFLYAAGEFISSDKRKSPVYFANALYAENLRRYLIENEFDAAICPHLFPMEALTYLSRKHELPIKSYFVSTDYTCIPFLEETEASCIFTPHADLTGAFVKRGISPALLVPSGIPVMEKYAHSFGRAESRTMLDLPEDAPCYLVMTGGEGCGDAGTLTRKLLERLGNRDARIVVLTGRNGQLYHALQTRYETEYRVIVLPYTEQVSLYLDACDVLLTKPGGISGTEAAVKGVPMIHTPPIPGCETLNARFFGERFLSIVASDEDNAADNAIRLADDDKQRARMLDAQNQYIPKDAAAVIAERILAL